MLSAADCKARGDAFFKGGNVSEALAQYKFGSRAAGASALADGIMDAATQRVGQQDASDNAIQLAGAALFLSRVCQESGADGCEDAAGRLYVKCCLASPCHKIHDSKLLWCLRVDKADAGQGVADGQGINRAVADIPLLCDLLANCSQCALSLKKSDDAIQFATVVLRFLDPCHNKSLLCRQASIGARCGSGNSWGAAPTAEEQDLRLREEGMWQAVLAVQYVREVRSPAEVRQMGIVSIPDMAPLLKKRWPKELWLGASKFVDGVCQLTSGMQWNQSCNVAQRLGPLQCFPGAIARYRSQPTPCILYDTPPGTAYGTRHPHANAPVQCIDYAKHADGRPSVHRLLSIGFCDLGQLLEVDNDGSICVEVLFVDMCHVAVAKSLVILAMMQDRRSEDASILEVWFSATWTAGTGRDFSRACRAVLHEIAGQKVLLPSGWEGDVARVVRHWSAAFEVPTRVARNACARGIANYMYQGCEAMNLTNTEAAADVLTHLLTRDVHGRRSMSMESNITFFGVPEDSPNERNANFLYAFTTEQFVAATSGVVPEEKNPADQSDSWSTGELVRKLAHFKMSAIATCRKQIREGTIGRVSFCCGAVCLSDAPLLHALRSFDPTVVSWSNCVDYIPRYDLHTLAQRVADSSARHHAYSMNWINNTKGGVLCDYPDQQELIKRSEQHIRASLLRVGAAGMFRHPPLLFAMNYGACVQHQRMFEHWLTYTMHGKAAAQMKEPSYFPFSRATYVMEFSWRYAP